MITENTVRERLETLKNHMYEELNYLKERLSKENRLGKNEFGLVGYKFFKHQKAKKKSCTYKKYRKTVL